MTSVMRAIAAAALLVALALPTTGVFADDGGGYALPRTTHPTTGVVNDDGGGYALPEINNANDDGDGVAASSNGIWR